MPNWKKLVVSGSDASLNSLNVQNAITASYFVGDGSSISNITLPSSISGSFSGSFQGDGSGLTNLTVQVNEISTAIENFSNQTAFTVIHGLNTKNIIVNVYDDSDRFIIPESIVTNDINSVDITFTENTSGRVVVAKGGHIVTGLIQSETTVTASYSNVSNFNIDHGFQTKNVFVTVYDNNDRQIIPSEVHLISDTSVNVQLASTGSGFAVVAKAGHIVLGTLQDADTLDDQDGTYYLDYVNFTNIPNGIVSSSNQLATEISGSFTNLSASISTRFDGLTSNYSELENIPTGIVSSSVQVSIDQVTGYTSFSSSIADRFDGLTSDFTELINIPSGLISGSSQVDYNLISNIPNGIVSSSNQVSYTNLQNIPQNIFSGSFNNIPSTPFITSTNGITASGHLVPSQNETYDLGTPSLRWRDLYLSGSTVYLGDTKITRTEQGDVEFRDSQTDSLRKIRVDELEIGSGASARKIQVDNTGRIKFATTGDEDRTIEALGFTGIITSSAQLSFDQIPGIPSGLVSSSNQVNIELATGYNSLVTSLQTYADNKVAGIVDSSPNTLNTLNELAAALNDDPVFATTVSTAIGEKLAKASNLSDLTNTSTARTNLGLGSAATKDSTTSVVNGSTSLVDGNAVYDFVTGQGYLTTVNYLSLGSIPQGIISGSVQIKSSLVNTDLNLGTGAISASGIHFADGFGNGTLIGTSVLVLSASAAVKVEGAPLRFSGFKNTDTGSLTPQEGDLIYNSTKEDLHLYKKGQFRQIIDSFNIGSSTALQGKLSAVNNLNDLASATSARTNLGLGSAATKSVGITVTSGLTSQLPHSKAVYDFVTGQGYITNSGNQTIDGTLNVTGDVIAYSTSDIKFKDNLVPIGNATKKIQKLTGYEFDWNDNQDIYKGHDIGVIAQEVEKVLPDLVITRQDGSKAVRYDKLVALLIQSNKELLKRIEKIESKLK
jgi:hypothetical protein